MPDSVGGLALRQLSWRGFMLNVNATADGTTVAPTASKAQTSLSVWSRTGLCVTVGVGLAVHLAASEVDQWPYVVSSTTVCPGP